MHQPPLRRAPVGCTEEAWETMLTNSQEPSSCPNWEETRRKPLPRSECTRERYQKLPTPNTWGHKGPNSAHTPRIVPMHGKGGGEAAPCTQLTKTKGASYAAVKMSILPCYAVFSCNPSQQNGGDKRDGKTKDKDGPPRRRRRRRGKTSRRWRLVATGKEGGAATITPFTQWQ